MRMPNKTPKMICLMMAVVCMIVFGGPLYEADAGVIKGTAIEEAIRTYVENNMFWPQDSVRIDFPGGISDVTLSGDEISCRIQSKRNEDFIGNTSFTVRFYEGGELLGKRTVRARLEVLMNVVISARSLAKGTTIGRGDVKLIRRWFARPPVTIIASLDDVVGKRLRTSVKPNTEITGKMVEKIPVVRKGKPVKIVVENGLMGVTTIGMSEQDGMRGELIKVRNVSSKKMIYARVMDTSLVRVEF